MSTMKTVVVPVDFDELYPFPFLNPSCKTTLELHMSEVQEANLNRMYKAIFEYTTKIRELKKRARNSADGKAEIEIDGVGLIQMVDTSKQKDEL